MNMFVMHFLFLLLLIRLIPGAIIFHLVLRDALMSPVTFDQVVSSLVLDDEIRDIKESTPYVGEFL